jgi:hypothetical protein
MTQIKRIFTGFLSLIRYQDLIIEHKTYLNGFTKTNSAKHNKESVLIHSIRVIRVQFFISNSFQEHFNASALGFPDRGQWVMNRVVLKQKIFLYTCFFPTFL